MGHDAQVLAARPSSSADGNGSGWVPTQVVSVLPLGGADVVTYLLQLSTTYLESSFVRFGSTPSGGERKYYNDPSTHLQDVHE